MSLVDPLERLTFLIEQLLNAERRQVRDTGAVANLSQAESILSLIEDNTDGLETKLDTLEARLATIITHVDGLEGFVDGLEALATTLNAQTDTLEALLSAGATESTLSTMNGKLPDFAGTWGYNAGTSGTVTLTGSKRVMQITAVALEAAGSMTINGGDTITIPYGATDQVSSGIDMPILANLTDPEIIFTGTDAYVVQWLTG